MLRPEFSNPQSVNSLVPRSSRQGNDVLLFMGGTDPDNCTLKILESLDRASVFPEIKLTVLLGPNSQHVTSISRFLESISQTVKVVVGSNSMAKFLRDFDLVIGATGTTSWERCALGIPTICFSIVANQVSTGEALKRSGAGLYLEDSQMSPVLHF